ncbi:MAG: Xaa-Pro peptidase family protein [Candidatus Roizmanbacteria bacterium]|nr:Xaa-Pro peptidase family protein [Candidatus Roizmanbacteria bacterium]
MIDASLFLQTVKTDAFLISQFYNIVYLTSFETLSPHEREAYLFLVQDKKIIITDARYKGEQHSADSELYILQLGEKVGEVIQRLCEKYKVKTVGCEANDLKWSEVQSLQKLGLDLIPINNPLSHFRSIKTEEELFAIKQACHIGDQVLKDITPYIHPGQTEKEIAWLLEKSIREGYGADIAFEPIVAVDAHGAIPHYNTKKGDGVIEEGSLLLIDFGVKAHNYCSDITRMVAVGDVGNDVIKTYSQLLDAQKKTIEFAQKAILLKQIDDYCRDELKKNNLPGYSHSTGHGIGLEVHESPRISAVSTDEKQVGQVFTIEPGVYREGKWGMRIEDTLTVSLQGEIEVLTRFPKDLILL